ncbi:MAG TPA: tetratricopeptide repeat protein [Gemmataceae bacterium]
MMLTEVQDRDAIVSRAIEIASAEERAAYIARACGNDPALRRQVEELVAAHFQGKKVPDKPAVVDAADGKALEQPRTHRADGREDLPPAARKYPRALTAVVALLLLTAVVGSASLAVWGWRAEEQAQTAVKQAEDERKHAEKIVAEIKEQRDQAEKERQSMALDREQALAAKKAAEGSAEDTKAVLAFLQNNVLSAGRQKGWAGGQWAEGHNKDVTLRKAVDAGEAQVAKAFADRPLAEASVRRALGSAYLDLGEAALAVKQLEQARLLRETLLGPNHRDTVDCRNELAVAYRRADRSDEADRQYNQDPDSPSHAASLATHGALLLSQKKPVEAERKLRESLTIRQKKQPDDWTTFDTKSMLGEALVQQKKYAGAETLLLSGYEGLKKRQTKIPSQDKAHFTKALQRLVQLYEAWDKKDKAAQWRKELETVEAAKKS